ncbi:MAG: DUF1801 domain-containing protein [Planctomycetes bacterium]|nr:DUF1801 domain-containing protein [Planctomycetota bacterium]
MQSKAKTVAEYLDSLPLDRRVEIEAVRRVLLDNLDQGFAEVMQYGMIGYCIPHSIFPDGYHCDPKQPLPFGGLAAQKNACSLYLMPLYMESPLLKWFQAEWKKTGKKLDMGKACIRFKKADDLALDVIAGVLKKVGVQNYIDTYVGLRGEAKAAKPKSPAKGKAKPAAAKASPAKKPAAKKRVR